MQNTRRMIVATAVALGIAGLARATDVKVWTSDVITDEARPNQEVLVPLAPASAKELKPVVIVGAKNGAFSGKIIVESAETIKGVVASVGALTGKSGVILATNIQIRYAKLWERTDKFFPKIPDILLASAPEVAPAGGAAILPIWITVHVPKDAKAGTYNGEVMVQTPGVATVSVALKVEVADWALPDPQDYRTWSDFIQSPDTLAIEYSVPLWSEEHWKLIDNSFRVLSPTGSRTVYVPLITGSNLGNEQSMVRWIKKNDSYEYDYTVLDRYLDSAEKNLGKPKLVIFWVWDIYIRLSDHTGFLTSAVKGNNPKAIEGKGPRVTAWDPATQKATVLNLPRYELPESKALWQPMFAEIKKRMEKRGLGKNMMLGVLPDLLPCKEELVFWNDISGDLPWVIQAHFGVIKDVVPGKKSLKGIADVGYLARVFNLAYNINPDKGRMYGWKNPVLLTAYQRQQYHQASAPYIREIQAFNITGGQRGSGRLAADYWPAIRNKNGVRSGAVWERYPESQWRSLDLDTWLLGPGPKGAVSTARLESFREGTQVCEARIFLEDALLDEVKKGKVGEELAKRCQAALDEHHRFMWKTQWSNDEDLASLGAGGYYIFPIDSVWHGLEKNGRRKLPEYYAPDGIHLRNDEIRQGLAQFHVGWQEREKKLFDLAGEVAAKLNAK